MVNLILSCRSQAEQSNKKTGTNFSQQRTNNIFCSSVITKRKHNAHIEICVHFGAVQLGKELGGEPAVIEKEMLDSKVAVQQDGLEGAVRGVFHAGLRGDTHAHGFGRRNGGEAARRLEHVNGGVFWKDVQDPVRIKQFRLHAFVVFPPFVSEVNSTENGTLDANLF